MYGIGGERRLTEFELPELPGYEDSKPVRVGNAASEQFQLDVHGEVAAVIFIGSEVLGRVERRLWPRWQAIVEHVETIWREPDDGIWEARGREHYTYSKVMAWVVFDRAVRIAERFELEAPIDRWKRTRDEIHREVCERGYDRERRTFTQYYGSRSSTPACSTSQSSVSYGNRRARQRDHRRGSRASSAATASSLDIDRRDRRRIAGRRGQFLACSFWLVNALARNGRVAERRRCSSGLSA